MLPGNGSRLDRHLAVRLLRSIGSPVAVTLADTDNQAFLKIGWHDGSQSAQ